MKRLLLLVSLVAFVSNLSAQSTPSYRFRKPILETGIWKFKSVISGVDAHVTITGSKNASLDRIDDSTAFAYAWQPNVRFTNRTTNVNDTSYLEFTIRFINRSTLLPMTQSKVAATIVDCDGPGNSSTYREFIRASMPGTVNAIQSSTIAIANDTRWMYFKSGTTQFSNIDTINTGAMAQINYTNVNTIVMRVGVLGRVNASDVRQFSFYFKSFGQTLTPLPVQLNAFDVVKLEPNALVKWSTSSEEHIKQFEITRSMDGVNFQTVGIVPAVGFSDQVIDYEFVDATLQNLSAGTYFYQLKIVESSQKTYLSSVVSVKHAPLSAQQLFSVYPNPAIDKMQLDLNDALDQVIIITIMDANGKLVKNMIDPSMNGRSIEIDIQDLKSGLYFIDVTDINGVSATQKFFKR
jgi:hypothetical protein